MAKTQAKIQRSKDNYRDLNNFIEEYGIDAEEIAPYQCRCNGLVDIYPTNKKYFLLKSCKWGTYQNLNELLPHIIENNNNQQE